MLATTPPRAPHFVTMLLLLFVAVTVVLLYVRFTYVEFYPLVVLVVFHTLQERRKNKKDIVVCGFLYAI